MDIRSSECNGHRAKMKAVDTTLIKVGESSIKKPTSGKGKESHQAKKIGPTHDILSAAKGKSVKVASHSTYIPLASTYEGAKQATKNAVPVKKSVKPLMSSKVKTVTTKSLSQETVENPPKSPIVSQTKSCPVDRLFEGSRRKAPCLPHSRSNSKEKLRLSFDKVDLEKEELARKQKNTLMWLLNDTPSIEDNAAPAVKPVKQKNHDQSLSQTAEQSKGSFILVQNKAGWAKRIYSDGSCGRTVGIENDGMQHSGVEDGGNQKRHAEVYKDVPTKKKPKTQRKHSSSTSSQSGPSYVAILTMAKQNLNKLGAAASHKDTADSKLPERTRKNSHESSGNAEHQSVASSGNMQHEELGQHVDIDVEKVERFFNASLSNTPKATQTSSEAIDKRRLSKEASVESNATTCSLPSDLNSIEESISIKKVEKLFNASLNSSPKIIGSSKVDSIESESLKKDPPSMKDLSSKKMLEYTCTVLDRESSSDQSENRIAISFRRVPKCPPKISPKTTPKTLPSSHHHLDRPHSKYPLSHHKALRRLRQEAASRLVQIPIKKLNLESERVLLTDEMMQQLARHSNIQNAFRKRHSHSGKKHKGQRKQKKSKKGGVPIGSSSDADIPTCNPPIRADVPFRHAVSDSAAVSDSSLSSGVANLFQELSSDTTKADQVMQSPTSLSSSLRMSLKGSPTFTNNLSKLKQKFGRRLQVAVQGDATDRYSTSGNESDSNHVQGSSYRFGDADFIPFETGLQDVLFEETVATEEEVDNSCVEPAASCLPDEESKCAEHCQSEPLEDLQRRQSNQETSAVPDAVKSRDSCSNVAKGTIQGGESIAAERCGKEHNSRSTEEMGPAVSDKERTSQKEKCDEGSQSKSNNNTLDSCNDQVLVHSKTTEKPCLHQSGQNQNKLSEESCLEDDQNKQQLVKGDKEDSEDSMDASCVDQNSRAGETPNLEVQGSCEPKSNSLAVQNPDMVNSSRTNERSMACSPPTQDYVTADEYSDPGTPLMDERTDDYICDQGSIVIVSGMESTDDEERKNKSSHDRDCDKLKISQVAASDVNGHCHLGDDADEHSPSTSPLSPVPERDTNNTTHSRRGIPESANSPRTDQTPLTDSPDHDSDDDNDSLPDIDMNADDGDVDGVHDNSSSSSVLNEEIYVDLSMSMDSTQDSQPHATPTTIMKEVTILRQLPVPGTPSKPYPFPLNDSLSPGKHSQETEEEKSRKKKIKFSVDKMLDMKNESESMAVMFDQLKRDISEGGFRKRLEEQPKLRLGHSGSGEGGQGDGGSDDEGEEFLQKGFLKDFIKRHGFSENIPEFHPGEAIFDQTKLRQIFTYQDHTASLTGCGFKPEKPSALESLMLKATPEELVEMVRTFAVEMAYHSQPCPPTFMLWMFKLMAVHTDCDVVNKVHQTMWSILNSWPVRHPNDPPWAPSLLDLTQIFVNYGASFSNILPSDLVQPGFEEKDIWHSQNNNSSNETECRESPSANLTDAEKARYHGNNLMKVIKIFTQTLITMKIMESYSCQYSEEEVCCLAVLVSKAALEKYFLTKAVTNDFLLCMAALLDCIPENRWRNQVKHLCHVLPHVATNHHNLVYVIQLIPLHTERGRYMSRQLAYFCFKKLCTDDLPQVGNGFYQEPRVQYLLDLLPACKPNTETDYYKLNSMIQILDLCVGNEVLDQSEKEPLQCLISQLRAIGGKIREKVHVLARSQVKDLIIRTTTKLTFMDQAIVTDQVNLFNRMGPLIKEELIEEHLPASSQDDAVSSSGNDDDDDDEDVEDEED